LHQRRAGCFTSFWGTWRGQKTKTECHLNVIKEHGGVGVFWEVLTRLATDIRRKTPKTLGSVLFTERIEKIKRLLPQRGLPTRVNLGGKNCRAIRVPRKKRP